jgi:glucan-binding YG repeat protein
MKYTEALAQKGLSLEELSKSIQKKVTEFTFLKEQIEALEQEDLDETTSEDLKKLSDRLKELDEEISVAITRFDKEKHLKKLQQLQESKRKSLEQKTEQAEPEVVAANIEAHTTETAPLKAPEPIKEQPAPAPKPQPAPEQQVPQYEEAEPQYVEAEEEFEVKRTQKSKNGSLNILLIGVGAFLITWGAVNMFRESKK